MGSDGFIGRRPTPQPVIGDLVRLLRQMDRDATRLIETHRRKAQRRGVTEIALSIAGTNTDATEIDGLREALHGRVAAALIADGYTVRPFRIPDDPYDSFRPFR